MDKLRFAIVGCGSVSGNRYFPNLEYLPRGELVAVCDSLEERAKERAEAFNVPYYLSVDELLAGAQFELLVNLTSVPNHFAVSLKALEAGKHVYSQKPMALTTAEATALIDKAKAQNLILTCEDSTPIQPVGRTVRKLINEGVIGKIVWARMTCTHWGPATIDNWPTDPTWFYKKGAGPLFDVGVERIQMVTDLMGPVKRVSAMSGINLDKVEVRGGPHKGEIIDVTEDDVTLLTMDFGDSRFALLDTAWVQHRATRTPAFEIYGQKGVISQSETHYSQQLELYRDEPELGIRGWTDVKLIPPVQPDPPGRVVGLFHTINCILDGVEPVISGERARHCIEVIEKAFIAARTGVTQTLETTF